MVARLLSKESISAQSPVRGLPAKAYKDEVEPRGVEPLPSAVQKRSDSLLELSRASKMPANDDFLSRILCSSSQEVYSGCCTDVTVCIRTRSRMIVIRPAAWSSLMRASS